MNMSIKNSLSKHNWAHYLDRFGAIIVLLVLVIIAANVSDAFFTSRNILNVLRQVSANGILSIGLLFVILTSGIDISIGSIVGVASVTMGILFAASGDVNGPLTWVAAMFAPIVPAGSAAGLLVALLVIIIFGAILGFINGFVICKANIQPFIMTIGTLSVYRGLALLMSGGRPIHASRETMYLFHVVGEGTVLGIPAQVIVLILFAILAAFLLGFTTFGRYLRAIGGNQEAARVAGIAVNKCRTAAYVFCGSMAAIAGFLLTSRTTTGKPNLGMAFEMDAIAACVIGGSRLTGGIGTVGGTLIGAVIIGVVNNTLNLANVSPHYQLVVRGLIIVLAVASRSIKKPA